MTWPQIVLILWFIYSIIVSVATVGKERVPVTPAVAAGSVAILGFLLWMAVIA